MFLEAPAREYIVKSYNVRKRRRWRRKGSSQID